MTDFEYSIYSGPVVNQDYDAACSNFILQIDNFVSESYCNHIKENIDHLLSCNSKHATFGAQESHALFRDDVQLSVPYVLDIENSSIQYAAYTALSLYLKFVPSVRSNFVSYTAKLQKTPAGSAGFSEWHIEQGTGHSASRALVWMFYLNDVEDGGETEFLFQRTKVKPKKGTIVVWPAGVTHPHRGNPPYSNDKYIVTGWFSFPTELENAGFEVAGTAI